MKKVKLSVLMFLLFFIMGGMQVVSAQDLYYDLKVKSTVKTTPTKDLQRLNSCWSNAGAALIEAEMIRNGKGECDLAVLDFVHNAYLLKAEAHLASKGKVPVTEKCLSADVFKIMDKYGMVPQSAYMKPEKNPMDKTSGEMDAILRGTLRMSLTKDEGKFTDRWKNTYDAALSRYIGDAKMHFKYNGKDYTPMSFAQESGVNASDYILLTSDDRQDYYKPFVLEMKDNWDKDKFYNVEPSDLATILEGAVSNGFAVSWYGLLDNKMIYKAEAVAIVPAGDMPGVKAENDTVEEVFEPVAEVNVSPEQRQKNFETLLMRSGYNFLTVYGISKDKKENTYIIGKDACKAGDDTINMSEQFVKLNTVYLLVNKNGLPKDIRKKLGL
jgi:bleomycin hydrolase